MNYNEEEGALFNYEPELLHYGVKRRSGRYPWGSGEDPYQHEGDFFSRVEAMRRDNLEFDDEYGNHLTGDTAIAYAMGISTGDFRSMLRNAKDQRWLTQSQKAKSMRDHGFTLEEIAKELGYTSESSVRNLLNPGQIAKREAAQNAANFLKERLKGEKMLDVGKGTELQLNISNERMQDALNILREEGYEVWGGSMGQVTNQGKRTIMKVLCPPGTPHSAIFKTDDIGQIEDTISYDDGQTFKPAFVYPKSMDSKRLQVVYAEQGGEAKDGLVELRRGVQDIDLGPSTYAQVRILVDGTHYIKGMAVYSDDLPDGVDVRFNTNKHEGTPELGPKGNTVLKRISDDPKNPFGSLIKEHGGQSYYIDKDGNEQLSLINKRAEEGDWQSWSNKLPSQFLAKQSLDLAKRQLGMTLDKERAEFELISSLENPTVKKKLLNDYADACDTAAVHLKAAALPRQHWEVILPMPTLKDNEVYAPGYDDGEELALVRFPHGHISEIPKLIVNNKNKEGIAMLGKVPKDAIGVNKTVADRMSGADFDGDTVLAIPTRNTKIKNSAQLEGLIGFDPKAAYPSREGMRKMKDTQNEMGKISNLIMDMTIKGAEPNELARAIRHSMVVIDAEKHELDYTRSYEENGIRDLVKKYQTKVLPDGTIKSGGVSTLITAAKSQEHPFKTVGAPKINEKGKSWYDPSKPEGSLIRREVYEEYTDKTGKVKVRTRDSTKMAETDDARTLISTGNHKMEQLYADYANGMKGLANQARMEITRTPLLEYNKDAAVKYQNEVDHLKAQLVEAKKNAPRERQAHAIANAKVKARKEALEAMGEDPKAIKTELKKVAQRELTEARAKVGAKRVLIDITPKDYEAIQAGAIHDTVLKEILNHTDTDRLREYATPSKYKQGLTKSQVSLIKSMEKSGYTMSEIANRLGVSTTTVSKYVNE